MSRKGVLRNYDSDGNLVSLECCVCHEIKAVSEFSKHKRMKDNVDTKCKDCHKKYDKKRYKENADKKKERRKEYYKENTDKEKQYNKEYRKQNKDKFKEYDKEYYNQNKDKRREYNKEYRKENADKIAEYMTEYRKQKVEQSLAEIKAYVEKDPKKYDYNPNKEIYGIVYLVHNVKSDKYYVGQTINSFDIRYKSGWLNAHNFKDTVKTDLELYGESSFEYTKIFKVAHNQRDLDKLEAYYIDYFNAYENGYNEKRGNIFTERTSYKINNIRFDWYSEEVA